MPSGVAPSAAIPAGSSNFTRDCTNAGTNRSLHSTALAIDARQTSPTFESGAALGAVDVLLEALFLQLAAASAHVAMPMTSNRRAVNGDRVWFMARIVAVVVVRTRRASGKSHSVLQRLVCDETRHPPVQRDSDAHVGYITLFCRVIFVVGRSTPALGASARNRAKVAPLLLENASDFTNFLHKISVLRISYIGMASASGKAGRRPRSPLRFDAWRNARKTKRLGKLRRVASEC